MLRDECETMTEEHIEDFKRLERNIFHQIQELCYFFRENSNFNIISFELFAYQFENVIRNILSIYDFSQRRKPIEDFEQTFKDFFYHFQDEKLILIEEIESSLEEIAEDLDKNELSEIDFYALSDNISQRKALFENIETLKHANLEYYESTKILITKGIIISTLTKHFNQLKEFYEEFPKEMNEEEKVKYRLNKRIQLLERENQSMKIANEKILKDRENWKNKFIALEKDYQNLNELVSDMKKENASLRKEKVLLQKENALLQKTKTDEQKKEENEKRKEEIQCSIEDMNEFFENVDKDDPEKIVEYISENLEDFQFLLEDLLENIKY